MSKEHYSFIQGEDMTTLSTFYLKVLYVDLCFGFLKVLYDCLVTVNCALPVQRWMGKLVVSQIYRHSEWVLDYSSLSLDNN